MAASHPWVSHHPPTLYPIKVPQIIFKEIQKGAMSSEEEIRCGLKLERFLESSSPTSSLCCEGNEAQI